jgi:hypothetical protein
LEENCWVVIKENGQYVSDAEAATAFNNHFIDKVGRLREGMVSGDNPLAATRRRAEKLGLKKSSFGIRTATEGQVQKAIVKLKNHQRWI